MSHCDFLKQGSIVSQSFIRLRPFHVGTLQTSSNDDKGVFFFFFFFWYLQTQWNLKPKCWHWNKLADIELFPGWLTQTCRKPSSRLKLGVVLVASSVSNVRERGTPEKEKKTPVFSFPKGKINLLQIFSQLFFQKLCFVLPLFVNKKITFWTLPHFFQSCEVKLVFLVSGIPKAFLVVDCCFVPQRGRFPSFWFLKFFLVFKNLCPTIFWAFFFFFFFSVEGSKHKKMTHCRGFLVSPVFLWRDQLFLSIEMFSFLHARLFCHDSWQRARISRHVTEPFKPENLMTNSSFYRIYVSQISWKSSAL